MQEMRAYYKFTRRIHLDFAKNKKNYGDNIKAEGKLMNLTLYLSSSYLIVTRVWSLS